MSSKRSACFSGLRVGLVGTEEKILNVPSSNCAILKSFRADFLQKRDEVTPVHTSFFI